MQIYEENMEIHSSKLASYMSDIPIETNKMTSSLKDCFKSGNKAFRWAVEVKRNCKATKSKELMRRAIQSNADHVACKEKNKPYSGGREEGVSVNP